MPGHRHGAAIELGEPSGRLSLIGVAKAPGNLANVTSEDGRTALVAERPQSLSHHSGAGGGVLLQKLSLGGLERIQLDEAWPAERRLIRLLQMLPNGAPSHVQLALDLADRPESRPIEKMNIFDLLW